MKKIFTTLLSLGMTTVAIAQWSPASMKGEKLRDTKVTNYYSLDINAIRAQLANAPETGKGSKPVIISMPTLDGKIEKFAVYSLPVLEKSLADRYQLGSYAGVGIDNPTSYVRFSIAPNDFQSMLFRNGQYEFIEPQNTEKSVYGVFPKTQKGNEGKAFVCKTTETPLSKEQLSNLANSTDFTHDVTNFNKASDKKYRTYRLAVSVNAEYTQIFGSVAGAFTQINATMTRVNGVFEKDFAIHLNVLDLPQLIFTDPATDPYTSVGANGSAPNSWNLEVQRTLTSTIGNDAYDVGHFFGHRGGGGSAGDIGNVCRNPSNNNDDTSKGAGITSPAEDNKPFGDNFDIDYVAHELGHQVGAEHSFTFTIHSNVAALEPGSGSTIMGYAGITSSNVQQHSDAYFHAVSILQANNYLNSQSCGTNTPITTNNPPVLAVMPDKTIPKGTAFVLTAAATDAENDPMTYTWEQYDVASSSLTSVTGNNTTGPKFRSLLGTTDPSRYFPRLSSVLNGTLSSATNWEAVSNVARTMNFRVTVRDNNVDPTKQQTQFGNQKITVGNDGPFKVTSTKVYNNISGEFMWDVAGTSAAPYNVSNVKIDYTSDNGATWNVLAASTANDGNEVLDFSNVADNAQITVRVSAIDNVFYAVGKVTASTMVNCNGTAPTGLVANSITQTGAKIDWEPFANATYNLKYKKASDATWTEVNNLQTNTYTISGLTLSTAYNVSVVAVCGGNPGANADINFTTKGVEYCAAGSNNGTLERISNVTFANINKNSTATTGYEDFTATVGNVTPGQSYNFSASHTGTTYSSDQVIVWIDYNKDGDFEDAGEQVLITGKKMSPWTGSIAIPVTAPAGQTTMRVRLHDSSTLFSPNATPCGNSGYGQVEDYTLNIGELAVSDVKKNNISIYPNPATDVINVSNVSSKTKFEIYSVGGQLVNQGTTDGKVNVSKLAKGVYILSLESNGEKSQTKFIKN